MAITATLPSVSLAASDLMHIMTSKLAILAAASGSSQKNFVVLSSSYKPPEPSFLDHNGYNETTKMVEVDATVPMQNDIPTITCVVEGFTDDFVTMFLNGATPVECEARLWGQAKGDATGKARFITDDFDCWAYLSGELSFVRENWSQATIMLRVDGDKPQWTRDASVT